MTTPKDLIINFINFVFALIVTVLTILYVIAGDNFEHFRRLMESIAPLGVLSALFLVNLKIWRERARKKEREANFDLTLHLTFFDKLKSDIVLFILPIPVLFFAFLSKGVVGPADIAAAALVFVGAYFWQKWLFSKER